MPSIPNPSDFQNVLSGKKTDLWILNNGNKMQVGITNYGARIVAMLVPDKIGEVRDVIIGYKNISRLRSAPNNYYGAVVGRFANRIANAIFTMDDEEFVLSKNNGDHSIHGGFSGFSHVVWEMLEHGPEFIRLQYLSADGEEGYPGNLTITLTYRLSEENELFMEFEAVSDRDTIISLTNHAYFNLHGTPSKSIEDHLLQMHADQFLPVNETCVPTGDFAPVADTILDFRDPKSIGNDLHEEDPLFSAGKGYDHFFVLDTANHRKLKKAALVTSVDSGISMSVETTEPGIQFYCDHFTEDQKIRNAFCLETQHFPDAPNQPSFPSALLKKGDYFRSKTIYRFSNNS